MKITNIPATLFLVAVLVLSSVNGVRAEVLDLPVDTEFFYFVFLMIVAVIISLVITIQIKRRSERHKTETPRSTESEDISKF